MKFNKWLKQRTLIEAERRVVTGRAPLTNIRAGLLGPGGTYGDPNRQGYVKQMLAAGASSIGSSLADELGKPSQIPHLQDPIGMFKTEKQSFDELPLQLPLINGVPFEGVKISYNEKQNVLNILSNMLDINPKIRILTDAFEGGGKFDIYKDEYDQDEKTVSALREKFKVPIRIIAKTFTTALSKARLYISFKNMKDFKDLDNKYDLINPSILKQIVKPRDEHYTLGNIFLYKVKKTYLEPSEQEED